MPCGCGGGAPAIPKTSGDYAAEQEAAEAVARFRLVRQGQADEEFATYAAARKAQQAVGGVVRKART